MKANYYITDIIKQFLAGTLKFADEDVVDERRAICEQCEIRNATLNICTICQCYIPAKTKLLESTCPMEKWK